MSKRQDNLTLTERYTPHPKELQHYGTVAHVSIALDASVRGISAENLNQLLVDTMTLRDLYKKHHWQVSGPTFYQLHLLFDRSEEHTSELQSRLHLVCRLLLEKKNTTEYILT